MKCSFCGEEMERGDFSKVVRRFCKKDKKNPDDLSKLIGIAVTRPAALYECNACGAAWEWVRNEGMSLVRKPSNRDLVSAQELFDLGIDPEEVDSEVSWKGK